jgi:hypothetical protein
MTNLYKRAILKLEADWPHRYKEICESVGAVCDWTDSDDAPDDLVSRVIYDTDNGVSSVGMAFLAWPTPRPAVGKYREMLNHLKEGLGAKFPSDEVAKCRQEFKKITKGKGSDSIFNRIVSAFLPGVVSPVMFEADFDDAWKKLVKGGYIHPVREKPGDDPWHSKNVQVMRQLRDLLPNGVCEGARWPIDDYTRGVFVWGVHADINMDDWMVVRKGLKN